MKNILSISVAAIMLMASCQSKKADSKYESTPAVNAAPESVIVPADSGTLPANSSVAPAASPQPVTGARPAVNPAHGQPFHDCNVAVGAPLPPAVQPVPNISAPDELKNNPAVKLNPAHGQPGHKCELPVGAPLS